MQRPLSLLQQFKDPLKRADRLMDRFQGLNYTYLHAETVLALLGCLLTTTLPITS